MKHLFFNDSINETTVEAFASKSDNVPEHEPFMVYFSSSGGNFSDAVILAELWNERRA